ncbi:uncharacterized protein ACO6RY_03109 [Pungitius sinensis]
MSANSSFPPSSSSSISLYHFLQNCYTSPAGTFSTVALTVCSLLLVLPPCVYVIYQGLKQRHSGTTASHSDVFTYHMVAVELMSIVGCLLCSCGSLTGITEMVAVGMSILAMNICGQQLFHLLTCVERYLAVVHPVTYLGLRSQKGVRVRKVSIGCVWMLCFANMSCLYLGNTNSIIISSVWCLAFIVLVIFFCSLSVLCVLIGPGPGARGVEGRQRVDRAKKRAFYTITVILVVVLVKVGGATVYSASYNHLHLESEKCTVWLSTSWLSLPSSLVLPLLFLHRAGKLLFCKSSDRSGQGSD